jgi:DNA-binding transcriptional ArsR family regulator
MEPDRIFAALANGTRRAMTESLLREGPQPMTRLAAPHAMTLAAIKKHLGVLSDAGIVTTRKVGRENICAVDPAALQLAAGWFERQSRFWTQSLDRLELLLRGGAR